MPKLRVVLMKKPLLYHAPFGDHSLASIRSPRRMPIRTAVVIALVFSGGIVLTPSALADSVANLKDAVASARGGTSCGPLSDNPVVEQAARIINQSTDDYVEHTARHVPITDPLPGLKDLGYGGDKAVLLQGARPNEADAIKGMLLEGYAAIPDCSYTDFGVDVRRNETTGYSLISVVLAGA